MKPSRKWVPLVLVAMVSAGCGASSGMGADASAAQQGDYGTTKQMVVDILHSPEGKTALSELMQDPSFKEKMVVSDADIAKALESHLNSQKNQSFLAQQVKDPKFAAALAKSIQPELLDMQKQLMKDPSYQKDMLVLMKSQDFSKHLEDLMQTPQFRGQVMKIMTEALQTPSFRMQFQDSLKKAVAESIQSSGGKGGQGGGQGQGGSQGGDSSGGGGSSEGS